MIKAGIIGGTGYTGMELLRLLITHPHAEITVVTSRNQAGKPVDAVHPNLKGLVDLRFEDVNPEAIAERCDVVFTAVPHGAAMAVVPDLLKAGVRVVDLSADYRMPTPKFEEVYGKKHTDPREHMYGLPELHPEVKDMALVGNPGCFPTGAILAAAPLVAAGIVDRVVFDSKTGISGAGQDPSETSHYPNLAQNVKPYNMTTHRHKAEMDQELHRLDSSVKISFTPHLVPTVRGILTTAHMFVNRMPDQEEVRSIYENYYAGKPFVRMNKPSFSTVRGSNFCDIAFEIDKGTDRIVVVSAIDNMVKGASMYGLDERSGLWMSGLPP